MHEILALGLILVLSSMHKTDFQNFDFQGGSPQWPIIFFAAW